jgi:P27 family predicted phage terminase small subunit
MGQRGPAPTPTAILKLRGSTLATQRRQRREARSIAGVPSPPPWLSAEEQAGWEELVPLLEGMGVLSRADGNALARYCRLWSRWRKMEKFIDERGEMYPLKGDDGHVKCFQQWPQVAIAAKLAQQLTRLEQEFGLTPAARTRIQVNREPEAREGQRHGKSRFFEAG